MEEVFVIVSYWFGASDDSRWGEEGKVECVVDGTLARASEISKEVEAANKGNSLYCYCDIIKRELRK